MSAPIGIATRHGAELHSPACHCVICQAHRELEAIIEMDAIIADAERRAWPLNPWLLLRKLNGPEPSDAAGEERS